MSSYVDKVLQPNESVLATGHMHWIVYARGVVLIILGLICLLVPMIGSAVIVLRVAGGLILLVGLVAALQSWIRKVTTEVAVTNKRVIKKTGLIRRLTAEMNMDKVESVDVDQSILSIVFLASDESGWLTGERLHASDGVRQAIAYYAR